MRTFVRPFLPLLRPSLKHAPSSRSLEIALPRTAVYYSSKSALQSRSMDPRERYTAGLRPVADTTFQNLESKFHGIPSELANGLRHMHKWGFVVYRGTYGDEEQWTTAMHWLYECALGELEAMLSSQDELDRLWGQLEFTVVDDRNLLEGATPHTVRELHRRWMLEASESERGGPLPENWLRSVESQPRDSPAEWEYYTRGPPGYPRYGYCVYIDNDALESIIAFKDQDKLDKDAYVRVIQTYYLDEPRPLGYEGDEEDEEILAVLENADEPIEGCTRHNVGWMKYRAEQLAFLYIRMHNTYSWDLEYRRPPELVPIGDD